MKQTISTLIGWFLSTDHKHSYSHSGNHSSAYSSATKVIGAFGLLGCLFLSSQSALSHGVVETKLDRYRVELEANNQDVKVRQRLISALIETEHFDEALTEIEQLRKQMPKNTQLEFDEASVRFEKGDFVNAVLAIDKFLKNSDQDQRALELSGRAKIETGAYSQAVADLTSAIKVSPTADLYVYRADAYVASGDLDAAINSLKSSVKTFGFLPLLMHKVVDLQQQLGLYPEAIDTIDQIIASMDSDARTEHLLTQKADILQQAGQAAAATTMYEHAYTLLQSRSERIKTLASSKDLNRKLLANIRQQNQQ